MGNKHERVGKPHSFQELSVVFPIKIYHNQKLYANKSTINAYGERLLHYRKSFFYCSTKWLK